MKTGKNKRLINYKITNEQFYYLAGIIDSSSSFFLAKHACGRRDKISGIRNFRWVGGFVVQNANPLVAVELNKILFCNDSYTHTLDIKNGNNRRVLKALRVCGPILDEILPKLASIIKIKKEHIKILLDFRKSLSEVRYHQHNPIPERIENYRNSLRDELRYLNSNEYKDKMFSKRIFPDIPEATIKDPEKTNSFKYPKSEFDGPDDPITVSPKVYKYLNRY